MIRTTDLTKRFGQFTALNNVNISVEAGSIYGLVGTNGSGKTTLLKHVAGIFSPTEGSVTISGIDAFDNENIKAKLCFIPDDLYFFENYSLERMHHMYHDIYPNWNDDRFDRMIHTLNLSCTTKLTRFSKGMQKQAAFALAMSAMPNYLLLDEPVDGLDPLARHILWNCIMDDVVERGMTVLISSHNLKELEGVCDTVGILDNGKLVLQRNLEDLKSNVHKIQIATTEVHDTSAVYKNLNILHKESVGSIDILIIRGKRAHIEQQLTTLDPLILDILPLTLEEIFIYELGGDKYEFDKIIL